VARVGWERIGRFAASPSERRFSRRVFATKTAEFSTKRDFWVSAAQNSRLRAESEFAM
jgi:hypothetical protein